MRLARIAPLRLRVLPDACALLLLAVLAIYAARAYLVPHFHEARFYQELFGPAVSFACGGGWRNVAAGENKPLGEFLAFRAPRVPCEEIGSQPELRPRAFQNTHLYLIGAAGLWWRWHGEPDWRALHGLYYALFALAVVAAYAVLRLGAPAPLAAAGAALFATAEAHLRNLVHLRDYSKAPFILAGAAATLFIVCRWRSPPPLLAAASVAAGLAAGLGIGFRQDLLLLVPFAVLSIAFFGGASPVADLKKKLLLITAFLAAFVVSGAPVLGALERGGNTSHVVLLGLMSPFDQALGVRASYYSFGDQYNDTYARALINSAEQADNPRTSYLRIASEPYQEAGEQYLRELVALAPADFATRALGAIVSALSYDYGIPFLPPAAAAVLWWALVALLVPVLRRDKASRSLLYPAFVLIYFTASTFLQFQERHVFHLAILHVAVLAWGAEALRAEAVAAASARRDALRPAAWRAGGIALARNGVAILLVIAAAYAALWGLRYLQASQVRAFFERAADPAAYTRLARNDVSGVARYAPEPAPQSPAASPWFSHDYVMARFDATKCGLSHVHAVLRYQAPDAYNDLTRRYRLAIDSDTRFLAPVFRSHAIRFVGIELPPAEAACVTLAGRRTERRLEVLPVAHLDRGWAQRAPFQTLWVEPWPDVRPEPGDYPGPGDAADVPRSAWEQLAAMQVVRGEDLLYLARGARSSPSGIAIRKRGGGEYLVQKPLAAARPGCRLAVAAEGEIEQGALVVGALTPDQSAWDASVTVPQPGPFRAIVLLKGSRAVPVIENFPQGLRATAAMVRRLGTLELCP